MRVEIDNVDYFRRKDLIDMYPCLGNYGYKCKKFEKENIYGQKYTCYERSVEISSLEELLKLKKDVKHDIIIEEPIIEEPITEEPIDEPLGDKYPFKILIYDDYIE